MRSLHSDNTHATWWWQAMVWCKWKFWFVVWYVRHHAWLQQMGWATKHSWWYWCQQWIHKWTYQTRFIYWQMSSLNVGRLKPIISPFITGYYFLQYMFNKQIYFLLFCTCKFISIVKKHYHLYTWSDIRDNNLYTWHFIQLGK